MSEFDLQAVYMEEYLLREIKPLNGSQYMKGLVFIVERQRVHPKLCDIQTGSFAIISY